MVAGLYHLHCRHGDSAIFSKFEFFKHHFEGVRPAAGHAALRDRSSGASNPGRRALASCAQFDLSVLSVAVARDFATYMAVTTWRQLQEMQRAAALAGRGGAGGSAQATGHDEL